MSIEAEISVDRTYNGVDVISVLILIWWSPRRIYVLYIVYVQSKTPFHHRMCIRLHTCLLASEEICTN